MIKEAQMAALAAYGLEKVAINPGMMGRVGWATALGGAKQQLGGAAQRVGGWLGQGAKAVGGVAGAAAGKLPNGVQEWGRNVANAGRRAMQQGGVVAGAQGGLSGLALGGAQAASAFLRNPHGLQATGLGLGGMALGSKLIGGRAQPQQSQQTQQPQQQAPVNYGYQPGPYGQR